jgi:2-oxoglutarate ferredoxin oxidoreductase subunit alpha
MQESLGVAVMGEIPCVIINVMRSGPSTGLATKPAQGDVMQAKWGTHGDHGIIVLSPSSVQDCYDLAIRAFNLAERYRTPVVLLADEIIGHMREQYVKWPVMPSDLVNRKQPTCDTKDYKIYDFSSQPDGIAPLAAYGSDYVFRINSSGHDESGAACGRPDNADKFIRHYIEKFTQNLDDIVITKSLFMDDAAIAIIAYGCSVRPARAAVKAAREQGIKAGLLQLETLWPFADAAVLVALNRAKAAIVPEMNMGQVLGEVQRLNCKNIPIFAINRVDSKIITPEQILTALEEAVK